MWWQYTPPTDFVITPQPDDGEIAAQIIGLFGVTTMGILFGIKTYNIQYKFLSYSRWLIVILYICSWAFTFSGLTLVLTNNGNYTSCLLSEFACDVFYSGTKICIYCWLIEKVWIVNAGRASRWDTLSYRFHILLLTPYIAIFILMILFHNAWLLSDGTCIIGLKAAASIPLLVYDFIINLYMTVLFVKPLMKIDKDTNVDQKTSRLREVAKRTMVASVVCLIASFANVCALAILNGQERGVICIVCCFMDVMINVITIHWVTTQPTGGNNPIRGGGSDALPSLDFSGDYTSGGKDSTYTSNNSQIGMDPHFASLEKYKKKKRQKFNSIPISEQYGGFGNNMEDDDDLSNWRNNNSMDHSFPPDYNPNHYMSATNTEIISSPAATFHQSTLPSIDQLTYQPYEIPTMINHNNDNNHNNHNHDKNKNSNHHQQHNTPVPFFSNGKYIMMTDDEDQQSSSRSPSVHESHSSKQSLTRVCSD
ncbi:unnamed protein product [Cunninghamella blakesleeana]